MTKKLRLLGPRIATANTSRVAVPAKEADPVYQTAEHKRWREAVVARAGRRCEAEEHGIRCPNAEPGHRMFADHVVELKDGGAPLDLSNGKGLCASHHVRKTCSERAKRMSR